MSLKPLFLAKPINMIFRFAERRSDIFGVGAAGAEQTIIGQKLGEEESAPNLNKVGEQFLREVENSGNNSTPQHSFELTS